MTTPSRLGQFATRHSTAIVFLSVALCAGGAYAAFQLPSSVFPQTNFPRVVILVDNGVMPADEMMATITRPIEESMKDIPGSVTIRSATGRGSAEINVFFTWSVDMIQSELYVDSRLAQIRSTLPASATTSVFRVTFASFPIIGVSLTSARRDITSLWETARYDLKPRFLRIPGVARVDLVGGRAPEFQIIVDPQRLQASHLSLTDVTDALRANNLIAPAGMHEENHTLYLAVVDDRARTIGDIEDLVVTVADGVPILMKHLARVQRGPEPVFNRVTAEGVDAVLINIRSQPDGSTLRIADQVRRELEMLARGLPPDMKLSVFYDQSLIVRESTRSVWEAIAFGLALSILILYGFLKSWGTTLVATLVIPVSLLVTLVAMQLAGLSFNLMTLGGIAAAIGLIIDDAIVVVEAIHAKTMAGLTRVDAVRQGIAEIIRPLVGSTLTPVVVFVPLAFLDGITGVFFRALALTMAVSLLTSLVLAVTLTPSLAIWLTRAHRAGSPAHHDGGFLLSRLVGLYERAVQIAIRHRWATLAACGLVMVVGLALYPRLESEFLPPMDEGGFVIDYHTPYGTSLTETNRQLLQAEDILRSIPEIDSYSRRTGARLALAITEPNNGDILVKLKPDRARPTADVVADVRHRLNVALPGIQWEFAYLLMDLIGDLMWAPQPIEIKVYSTDVGFLKTWGPEIERRIAKIPGVVDTFNGLVYAGASVRLKVRSIDARRFGLTGEQIAAAVNTAILGDPASMVLEADRVVNVRVKVDPARIDRLATLRELPIRAANGTLVQLSQVVDITEESGQLEFRREDLKQDIAVTARLEGRDLGSAMAEISSTLGRDNTLPHDVIEYGGLYQQQQESFRQLLIVLAVAIVLVFTVLLIEFRSFREPSAIVFGAVLAMVGSIVGLWITGTSLNVVSLLGAIIGVGIVAKNGILMLDFVDVLHATGEPLDAALVHSGRRRLRPVLMTSMAAALGMLPLAYGIGSGADMLRPLAIAIIGALCLAVLLSLIATPVVFSLMAGRTRRGVES